MYHLLLRNNVLEAFPSRILKTHLDLKNQNDGLMWFNVTLDEHYGVVGMVWDQPIQKILDTPVFSLPVTGQNR